MRLAHMSLAHMSLAHMSLARMSLERAFARCACTSQSFLWVCAAPIAGSVCMEGRERSTGAGDPICVPRSSSRLWQVGTVCWYLFEASHACKCACMSARTDATVVMPRVVSLPAFTLVPTEIGTIQLEARHGTAHFFWSAAGCNAYTAPGAAGTLIWRLLPCRWPRAAACAGAVC